MRKSILATAVGSAALLLSGAAMAAGPAFANAWKVDTSGTISLTGLGTNGCAADFSCAVVASGKDFLQVQMTSTTDPQLRYFSTFITEGSAGVGVSGDKTKLGFMDESHVQTGKNGIQGVYDSQSMQEAGFKGSGVVRSGWASDAGTANMSNVEVGLNINAGQVADGDSFVLDFSAKVATNNATKVTTASFVKADQVVYLGNATDKQHFFTQIQSAAAGSGGAKGFAITDPTVTWAANDKLQVVWIGQNMPGTPSAGTLGTERVIVNDGTPFTVGDDPRLISTTSMGLTGPFKLIGAASTDVDTIVLPTY